MECMALPVPTPDLELLSSATTHCGPIHIFEGVSFIYTPCVHPASLSNVPASTAIVYQQRFAMKESLRTTRMTHLPRVSDAARRICVAVCCSVLQCAAVCCSVLQCAAVCCSVLQCVAVCCSVLLQCVAMCCSALQCVAACCGVLPRVLQRVVLRVFRIVEKC